MQKFFLLSFFILLLLGAGCQKTTPPQEPPTPLPASDTSTMDKSSQEKIEASFETNDYLDEALEELDEVE